MFEGGISDAGVRSVLKSGEDIEDYAENELLSEPAVLGWVLDLRIRVVAPITPPIHDRYLKTSGLARGPYRQIRCTANSR